MNDGSSRMGNVVLEISVLEKSAPDSQSESFSRPRVLVGHFAIQGKAILNPGYMTNYEMLLRNFSPDCTCTPRATKNEARRPPPPATLTAPLSGNAPVTI